MSQKKTVFERLEDTMIELQRNIETKLANLQTAIENVKNEIPKAIGSLREEIPRSIGQNLMSFADVIGAKIEDIEEAIKKIGGSTSQPMESSSLNNIQNDLNSIKSSILNLQTTLKNIKIEAPTTTSPSLSHTPSVTPSIATPSYTPPQPLPPISKPPPVTTLKPIPPNTIPSKPTTTIGSPSTSRPAPPPAVAPKEGPLTEVFKLLDSLKEKAQSGINAIQLANEMEQTRDAIVKIFRWHPALYELATFARRLKKYAEGAPLDNETKTSLLEKVEEWKNRINT
jgi:hypothetical protein